MPIRFRNGSKIGKTVKTTKNFPLTIEHVRKMFEVADLRERVILSTATDLGLRISDFIQIKKTDLPPLDIEPPIPFEVMTSKENVIALALVADPGLFSLNATNARLDAVLVLVSIAFIAILAIGAWIGCTMASTPPPKPIEEITAEIEEKKETPK